MALRIAVDLDGVLADMDSEVKRQADALFTQTPSPGPDDETDDADEGAPLPTRLLLTVRQQNQLWRHIRAIPDFWAGLDEIEPGAIARLAELASNRRWEVIFLTSRPRTTGDTVQTQTQRWLKERGFPMPSVFVVKGSRGLIAASLDLDVVIDDRMENCMDVVSDSRARAILIWRETSQHLPTAAKRLGITVVPSVAECLDALVRLETGSPGKPTPFNRVKRLLGLREPAVD